jgi:2-polyprenyl-3-methyl-5-hydroxy-6-metoxy-1,4-benzoquinol methylase
MRANKRLAYKEYWDRNIDKWGDLYLDISHGHETLKGSKPLTWIYNRTLVPYEAVLMKVRYRKTIEFIEQNIKPGMIVTDIGCGTGIFVVQCLLRGARVNAIDLSDTALEITRKNVMSQCPRHAAHVSYQQCDGQEMMLPQSDFTICVGVLPYVGDTKSFLTNILTPTKKAFIQYSAKNNVFNWVRTMLPFLNVRSLKFQTERMLTQEAEVLGFKKIKSEKFATGRLLTFAKE